MLWLCTFWIMRRIKEKARPRREQAERVAEKWITGRRTAPAAGQTSGQRCSISQGQRSTTSLFGHGHGEMGWTLNEYALTTLKGGRVVASKSEEEIYTKLKLAYIEPELREMSGEIEAAEHRPAPQARNSC